MPPQNPVDFGLFRENEVLRGLVQRLMGERFALASMYAQERQRRSEAYTTVAALRSALGEARLKIKELDPYASIK